MKVTPRVELLEEIVTNGITGASGGINWLSREHHDIPANVYRGMVENLITSLTGAVGFLKELEREVEK